jgi:hopanoid biosynthesis associated protein HpnK
MVAGAAAADAIARARRLPELRVGLHLVLVRGRAALPPNRIPNLAGPGNQLPMHLFRAGVAFFFHPGVRRQLAEEIRAQFEAFRSTGLALDHVNAHNHMHLHPTVFHLVLAVGRKYGLSAVRVPYEPPLPGLPGGWLRNLHDRLVVAPWAHWMARRCRRAGLHHNQFVFGMHDTGRMTTDRVLRILARLPEGTSELYLHPATRRAPEDGLPSEYLCEQEWEALMSPRVAAAIRRHGIQRTSYSGSD